MTAARIAFAAALFVSGAGAAVADCWDTNLANRYPGYAAPGAQAQALGYDPVRVQQGRNAALPERQNRTASARRGPSSKLR